VHTDSARFANSSLAAEKADALLTGAVPAFAKHPRSPGARRR
jgi:phosphotransacetylase